MDDICVFLAVVNFVLLFLYFRNLFKVFYYEKMFHLFDVDISEVEKMPWYKIWIN